ncbi:MAG TPA: hypothetical protein VFD79_06115 [Tissierellaceae bacterium]|nr:hypothetical protein [Tissierellaceae bacterium]
MNRDDFIKDDIKKIFDDEASEIKFTDEMMENVLDQTTRSGKGKIRRILNYELQIPLIPAAVAVAAILAVSILPEGILEKQYRFTAIEMAGSQVMVQEDKEVTRR